MRTWQIASIAGLAACLTLCAPRPAAAQADAVRPSDAIVDTALDILAVAVDRHWHKGEYGHIINLNLALIAADPAYMDAYANTAWLMWSLDRDADAVALYRKGIAYAPRNPFLYGEIGMYYTTRKRDWKSALPYYEKAGALPTCPAPTVHMLAHAYERTGQLAKAERTWQKAVNMKFNETREAAKRNLERVRKLRGARSRAGTPIGVPTC